jgi:hypothetical protein
MKGANVHWPHSPGRAVVAPRRDASAITCQLAQSSHFPTVCSSVWARQLPPAASPGVPANAVDHTQTLRLREGDEVTGSAGLGARAYVSWRSRQLTLTASKEVVIPLCAASGRCHRSTPPITRRHHETLERARPPRGKTRGAASVPKVWPSVCHTLRSTAACDGMIHAYFARDTQHEVSAMKTKTRKLLTATIGIGSVSYLIGCSDDAGGLTSGNLVAPVWPTDAGPNETSAPTATSTSEVQETSQPTGTSDDAPDAQVDAATSNATADAAASDAAPDSAVAADSAVIDATVEDPDAAHSELDGAVSGRDATVVPTLDAANQ